MTGMGSGIAPGRSFRSEWGIVMNLKSDTVSFLDDWAKNARPIHAVDLFWFDGYLPINFVPIHRFVAIIFSAVSERYSKISPGWQLSVSQIASRVEKRIALALPVLRMDRFCGVMPTASAKSFSRIFRCARTTSRLTIIGINPTSNSQFLFLFEFLSFAENPCDKANDQPAKNCASPIVEAYIYVIVREIQSPKEFKDISVRQTV